MHTVSSFYSHWRTNNLEPMHHRHQWIIWLSSKSPYTPYCVCINDWFSVGTGSPILMCTTISSLHRLPRLLMQFNGSTSNAIAQSTLSHAYICIWTHFLLWLNNMAGAARVLQYVSNRNIFIEIQPLWAFWLFEMCWTKNVPDTFTTP